MSNVLIVESQEPYFQDLIAMVGECGVRITKAIDYGSALKTIVGSRVQILILEWGHESEGARELVAAIRKNHRTRRAHVIAVSENRTPEMLADALNATVEDYFSWPVSISEIRSRLLWAANRFEQLV